MRNAFTTWDVNIWANYVQIKVDDAHKIAFGRRFLDHGLHRGFELVKEEANQFRFLRRKMDVLRLSCCSVNLSLFPVFHIKTLSTMSLRR